MPVKKKKGKIKAKKSSSRKPVRKKTAHKQALKKKASRKKALVKKTAKKTGGKSASTKTARRPSKKQTTLKKSVSIEPGPPSITVPPVEEPATNEEAIGIVTHYYSHLGVAVVQVNKGVLKTGDLIHMKGHTTDVSQTVESMEYEHGHVDQASAGQSIGIKVQDHVREHDIVYLVK
jgi:putative protease